MQIWPLIHTTIERARQIHAEAGLYDDSVALLAAIDDSLTTLDVEFALPTTDRDYWLMRDALQEIPAACAAYAQDGNHGPYAEPNPTAALLLHLAGAEATAQDDPNDPYDSWETLESNLTTLTDDLDEATTPPPEDRDHDAIIELLTQAAALATLFTARAALTIHDDDPHPPP